MSITVIFAFYPSFCRLFKVLIAKQNLQIVRGTFISCRKYLKSNAMCAIKAAVAPAGFFEIVNVFLKC